MNETNASQASFIIFSMKLMKLIPVFLLAAVTVTGADLNKPPKGFKALFNGKDLKGWWGLGTEDPEKWMALGKNALAEKKAKSLENIKQHWSVKDGILINDGKGLYLSTVKNYGDFELYVDYKTVAKADSGIYLRGVPQVQIWDTTKEGGKWKIGADKGSGGLWNNGPAGTPGRDPLGGERLVDQRPFALERAVFDVETDSTGLDGLCLL